MDPERTSSILRAAYRLLKRVGLEGMTTTELAHEAGVSTATLYRRWRTKEELAFDAYLAHVEARTPHPSESGPALDLLRAHYVSAAKAVAGAEGRVLASLIDSARRSRAVKKSLLRRFLRPRRTQVRKLLERAASEGMLRTDVDPELLLDAIYGSLYFRLLVGHAPVTQEFAERHLALVLEGAGNRPGLGLH